MKVAKFHEIHQKSMKCAKIRPRRETPPPRAPGRGRLAPRCILYRCVITISLLEFCWILKRFSPLPDSGGGPRGPPWGPPRGGARGPPQGPKIVEFSKFCSFSWKYQNFAKFLSFSWILLNSMKIPEFLLNSTNFHNFTNFSKSAENDKI